MTKSLALCFGIFVVGCGGGATFRNGLYEDRETAFTLGLLPQGWEAVHVRGGPDLAWNHKQLSSAILVNHSCNPDLDIPLHALTQHLLIGFTERDIHSQETVPMDSREALRTLATAKLDGVLREIQFVVLKKNGCVYDFALVGPQDERFTRAQNDYRTLIAGFETHRP